VKSPSLPPSLPPSPSLPLPHLPSLSTSESIRGDNVRRVGDKQVRADNIRADTPAVNPVSVPHPITFLVSISPVPHILSQK
jgi:hypothetical protein